MPTAAWFLRGTTRSQLKFLPDSSLCKACSCWEFLDEKMIISGQSPFKRLYRLSILIHPGINECIVIAKSKHYGWWKFLPSNYSKPGILSGSFSHRPLGEYKKLSVRFSVLWVGPQDNYITCYVSRMYSKSAWKTPVESIPPPPPSNAKDVSTITTVNRHREIPPAQAKLSVQPYRSSHFRHLSIISKGQRLTCNSPSLLRFGVDTCTTSACYDK